MDEKVIALSPTSLNPMLGAAEIEITGRNSGRLASANNYGSHGEPVRCVRAKSGRIIEIWLAATKLVPGPTLARELTARYGDGVAPAIAPEPGVTAAADKRRRPGKQATAPADGRTPKGQGRTGRA
jgi:hypothetical protein